MLLKSPHLETVELDRLIMGYTRLESADGNLLLDAVHPLQIGQ
jgi:hypothetical protein